MPAFVAKMQASRSISARLLCTGQFRSVVSRVPALVRMCQPKHVVREPLRA
jgi:hypothetical protein